MWVDARPELNPGKAFLIKYWGLDCTKSGKKIC